MAGAGGVYVCVLVCVCVCEREGWQTGLTAWSFFEYEHLSARYLWGKDLMIEHRFGQPRPVHRLFRMVRSRNQTEASPNCRLELDRVSNLLLWIVLLSTGELLFETRRSRRQHMRHSGSTRSERQWDPATTKGLVAKPCCSTSCMQAAARFRCRRPDCAYAKLLKRAASIQRRTLTANHCGSMADHGQGSPPAL